MSCMHPLPFEISRRLEKMPSGEEAGAAMKDAAKEEKEEDVEEGEAPSSIKEEETEPKMWLAQWAFLYSLNREDSVKQSLLKEIVAKCMTPFYEHCCKQLGWNVDEPLLDRMRDANSAELAVLHAKKEEAESKLGDMEVLDALFAIARFEARIGNKEGAFVACDVIRDKSKVSTGKKIDACMTKLRVALFYLDATSCKDLLAEAKQLSETGGDWDRNNRLAVYEAILCIVNRDLKGAAALLLDGVATFTCTELCEYSDFVFYAVLTNVLSLSRPDLKKKVVDSPDIRQVHIPHLGELVLSLYDCDYEQFFRHLLGLEPKILTDRYLSIHARYIVREMRVLIYAQFLDAYKTVTLDAMARLFGVSIAFLDGELAHFISQGRLNAKIDKVDLVVETNRPDIRSAHYQTVIKQGDHLLNQIQKLARSVSI